MAKQLGVLVGEGDGVGMLATKPSMGTGHSLKQLSSRKAYARKNSHGRLWVGSSGIKIL